jgi:apolipoprotein N-acyltransferase
MMFQFYTTKNLRPRSCFISGFIFIGASVVFWILSSSTTVLVVIVVSIVAVGVGLGYIYVLHFYNRRYWALKFIIEQMASDTK